MTNSIEEIADAKVILAIGTNTTVAHPIIGMQVRQAVKRGGKLIVANPREIELCRIADIWLQQRPGTDIALIGGMMKVILDEGLVDKAFIEERTEDFESFAASLKDFDLERVELITGVKAEDIRRAARMYAENSPASILYTMGITQHTHGTDNVMTLADLAMMTGNIGKRSSGVNPLRGQNNVQGACDVGCLPNVYTGYQRVGDPGVQAKFEEAWGVKLSDKPGLTLSDMFGAAHEGKIKAMYLVGENPVLSDPDAGHVTEAIKHLEFFIVQDIFLTETAKLADVVLPAVTYAEKDGTFTNTERRVQRVRKAIPAIGEAKDDWWIVAEIAKRLGGKGFEWASAEEVMAELAKVTPSYGGISFARLEEGGLQWPCPTEEHPGTAIMHTTSFSRGKGKFVPLNYRGVAEEVDEEYPLLLTTGRRLEHYHTGTMTRKVKGLNALSPEEMVEINPVDAELLGIKDGDRVKVASRRGAVEVKAKVTEASGPGVVFMSFHFAETATNLLTNPAVDPISKIPELKACAVRLEKARSAVKTTLIDKATAKVA